MLGRFIIFQMNLFQYINKLMKQGQNTVIDLPYSYNPVTIYIGPYDILIQHVCRAELFDIDAR